MGLLDRPIDDANATLTASTRDDRASINTWIAGQPTVTMPTSGIGNFNGAAVGTVFNNGATYLAAGSFNNTYNFGSTPDGFDQRFRSLNFTGTVSGSGSTYTGSLAGGNKTGAVVGQFSGQRRPKPAASLAYTRPAARPTSLLEYSPARAD